MIQRLTALRQTLQRKNLDAIFVSKPANVSYLSGFKGEDSFVFVTIGKKPLFITDFRYKLQAQKEVKGFDIICVSAPTLNEITQLIKKYRLRRVAFEAAGVSFKYAAKLKAKVKNVFVPTDGLIEYLRTIKDKSEIENIKKAAQIASEAIRKTISLIKPGMTEIAACGHLEQQMRNCGAEKIAFTPIVASGENASMPHAALSSRKIRLHEPVTIDCGCTYNAYNSDLTRTFFLGRIDAQYKYMYNIIEQAQQKAISIIRPGVKISKVDNAARDYITSKGFGKYFGHATGHGIGLEVHEAPRISGKNNKILKEGMVFTVEPGIYIPGKGGIRIEDMVLVTEKSHKILTESTY